MKMPVEVVDPFGVATDPKMPFLKDALNPEQAGQAVTGCLSETNSLDAVLTAIRVRRYKTGRRCLIEYELRKKNGGSLTILGKARAKGTDRTTFEVVRSLWNSGFNSDAADNISVPEPLGLVPAFNMWLQAKVEGELATKLLVGSGASLLGVRIAEAAHKVHSTPIATSRRHTIAHELAILGERFAKVKALRPAWAERLDQLLAACERLGASLSSNRCTGIHRDFYSDHIIADAHRVWMLDFDLYCQGDPALDIGNFIAHLTELSLRTRGHPAALRNVEEVLENRFVELSGEQNRPAVAAYTTLSLARHIYISTLFPDRQPFSQRLLEICEERAARM